MEAIKGKESGMCGYGVQSMHPELKEVVSEASRALALLDADRLEELALSCQALNRDLVPLSAEERREWARQSREAVLPMVTFAKVLDATGANLRVIKQLRDIRMGNLGYGDSQILGWAETGTGSVHGDH
jgi:hypothetical protein